MVERRICGAVCLCSTMLIRIGSRPLYWEPIDPSLATASRQIPVLLNILQENISVSYLWSLDERRVVTSEIQRKGRSVHVADVGTDVLERVCSGQILLA